MLRGTSLSQEEGADAIGMASVTDEHHAVYRQDRMVSIQDVMREHEAGISRGLSKKYVRKDVKAGGLFCSHRSLMTYVVCSDKANHFRHVVARGVASGGPGGGTGSVCGCSSRHLDAQIVLRDHDYAACPLVFTEWRDCKLPGCAKQVYTAGAGVAVTLEVREQGGKIVSDVVYSEEGEPRFRVEVWASHRTDRTRRSGLAFAEVAAEHVLSSIGKGMSAVLRCEAPASGELEVCRPCADSRRAREEAAAREKELIRQREALLRRQRAEEARRRAEEARAAEVTAEQRRAAAEQRRAEEARAAEQRRAAAEQRRAEEARAAEQRVRVELERVSKLEAASAAFAAKRAEAAERMAVASTPSFCVRLGTDFEQVGPEEVERRRAERLARRAAQQSGKKKRRRG